MDPNAKASRSTAPRATERRSTDLSSPSDLDVPANPGFDIRVLPAGTSAVIAEIIPTGAVDVQAVVHQLDAALASRPAPAQIECVPATTTVLVAFDTLATDHDAVEAHLRTVVPRAITTSPVAHYHDVVASYGAEDAPDLRTVAEQTGMSIDEVIKTHIAGDYRVAMYGFAPGYAYLTGVPEPLRLPRKPTAVPGVPAGSIIIAGAQCLITTITMPTGWWVIGRTDCQVLTGDPDRPFLFDVGDGVRFCQKSAQTGATPEKNE